MVKLNASQVDVIRRGYIEHGLAGAALHQWVLARCPRLTAADIVFWLQTKRWTADQLERRARVTAQRHDTQADRLRAAKQARDILANEIWLAKREMAVSPPYKGSWGWE
jgi:hypothetical protein